MLWINSIAINRKLLRNQKNKLLLLYIFSGNNYGRKQYFYLSSAFLKINIQIFREEQTK